MSKFVLLLGVLLYFAAVNTNAGAEVCKCFDNNVNPDQPNQSTEPTGFERKPSYKILLKSRQFIPKEGLDEELKAKTLKAGERMHVMIQFYDIPNEEERLLLEKSGVRLLDYIPEFTYFASISSLELNLPKVRAVVSIKPDDKISPHIKERGVGEWAKKDGYAKLTVMFFEDVPKDEAIKVVEKYGYVDDVSEGNIFVVTIPESAIYDLAGEDGVEWIEEVPPGNTVNLDQARITIGAEAVQAPPYNLDGSGVTVAMWDGGWVDVNHDDFSGRLTIGDTVGSTSSHATHVAGIMAGDGKLSPSRIQRGIATKAYIRSYEWPDSISELDSETSDAISHNAILSQNSWSYDISAANGNCDLHGDYDSWSHRYDEIVNGDLGDEIVVVCSAGNEENDGDCPPYPYWQLNPPICTAKNTICVGAVYSDTLEHTCFSSRGPTDDGRLKPDLVAPGDEANDYPSHPCCYYKAINSTIPGDSYGDMCGTSMSAPMVSGAIALLRQQFNKLGYGEIKPHTYKAILIQTADDLGNPGPDYTYGYGELDVKEAIDLIIRNYPNNELIRVGSVADGEIDIYYMSVPSGVETLRVTLVWDDIEGTPAAAKELVNDLDLYLVSPNGTIYHAYKLNPSNPANPATTGWNSLDNVEVVEVNNPQPGKWMVKVLGWIVSGVEEYTVVMPYEDINCGDVIYHSVKLGHDLVCSGTGLIIGADDVVIDCDNHYLIGSGIGYGIENTYNNVTITHCRITNFDYGIYMHSIADHNHILNNSIYQNDYHGVFLDDAWWNEIRDNSINSNGGNGLLLNRSKYNDIASNNFINNSWHGIQLKENSIANAIDGNFINQNHWSGIGVDTDSNTLENNYISYNSYHGIHLNSANNNEVRHNWIWNNSESGVYAYNSTNTKITDNWIYSNRNGVYLSNSNCNNVSFSDILSNDNGVYLYHSGNNVIRSNDFSQNNKSVRLYYSNQNLITNNDIESVYYGFYIWNSDYNDISLNEISNSGTDGMYMYYSDYNDVTNNTFENNGGWEIYLVYSNGNEFRGNIINHPNSFGIYSSNSNSNEFYDNVVCGYSWDFYTASSTYNANNNTCDSAYHFSDAGQSSGCDWKCCGCRMPENDMIVTQNLTLCSGTYHIPDTGLNGIILITADNVWLDCNNSVFVGDGDGIGLYFWRANYSRMIACSVKNYTTGFRFFESHDSVVENSEAMHNHYGVYFSVNAKNNYLYGNSFCSNTVDVYSIESNGGDENLCNVAINYADNGQSYGCDFECSGCRKVEDDMYIEEDTVLCPYTYYINDSGTPGVVIVSEGVTLNCNGARITGNSSGYCIKSYAEDATITGCSIDNYTVGIFVTAENNTIRNNSVSNTSMGVEVLYTEDVGVISNVLYSNLYGLGIGYSSDCLVEGNAVVDNEIGIYLSNVSDSILSGNTVCNNTLYDILMSDGSGNTGFNNVCDKPNNWNDSGTFGCTYACRLHPVANFTYKPENPMINETVEFNASLSHDLDGYIVSYEWEFGDDNSTAEADPVTTHSYATPGCYIVNLTVTDNDGLTNQTSKCIAVGCGDVNCDGSVNMGDVIALLYHVGYGSEICSEWAANVNGDSDVNMGDVIKLLYHVGYGEELECSC